MGSLGQAQNDTESIAQFMQRLSQATNIFISPEDPTGKEQSYQLRPDTRPRLPFAFMFHFIEFFFFFFFFALRVFWRVADVGVSDVHHVRPGDAASRPAPASGPHPASTVPVLHPELPERQRAHR